MTIVNFKNISKSGFDEDALITTTNGEHVINFGRLTTTGDLANGIFANADSASISNFGRIETSGLGAAGIYVEGANAHIDNFGSIVTHGDFYDPDPNVDGNEFFSEGIFANGDGFHIANYGSVRVEGDISSGLVGAGSDGVIINYGHIESSSIESGVVVAIGDRTTAINVGTLIMTGDFTSGLSASGESAVAINLGQILTNGSDGFTGMGSATGDNSQITNKGVIHVTADDSFGILARVGDELHVSNFGRIETEGTFAVGIATGGFPIEFGIGGLATEIINAGYVSTEGELALGVTLGLTRIGFVRSADGQIVNSGTIQTEGDGAAGVVMIGDGHHLANSGRITTNGGTFESDFVGEMSAAGVVVAGDNALIENTRTGIITSKDTHSAAVELNVLEQSGQPAAGLSSELDNFGLIRGASFAVLGGAGEETVNNHGRIVGDVVLGDGADTFVFGKGGILNGELFLGGGDDLVRIEDGSGTSQIADFAAGPSSGDVIDVHAFFSSFGALKAHSHQNGQDMIINLDNNDNLNLLNVHLSALNANDFLFA